MYKSDYVSQEILNRIYDGTWPPGSRLPSERELIEMFGVSRVSIRKATANLAGKGILNPVQGDGTFINRTLPGDYLQNALRLVIMDEMNYKQIQEFRLLLEPAVAAQAASAATQEDLDKLCSCIIRQKQAEANDDLQAYLVEDNLFHNLLAESLHNTLMTRVSELTQDLLHMAMDRTAELTKFNDGVSYHQAIYKCILNHNAEGARANMWFHINRNIDAWSSVSRENKKE